VFIKIVISVDVEFGPAGDAASSSGTKEPEMPPGMLSPIMEVRSENISPLVSPRDQLLSIPEREQQISDAAGEKAENRRLCRSAHAAAAAVSDHEVQGPQLRVQVEGGRQKHLGHH
jgi:hypothetical protein